jgi:3-methyladenine DNA glycosylase AlkC
MADTLKSRYGPEVPERIAAMIVRVSPSFPARAFVAQALDGYEALELMARARQVAQAMAAHLPPDYPTALDVVVRSLGPPADRTSGNGMAPFLYLPHVFWIAANGLDHLGPSVDAMREITRRFTFEFGIRPFIERHPRAMLDVLDRWTGDPDVHVRRLVSEGTRPRLPWAPRLRVFERDPRPVIALLERLRDDPHDYVRRSVANHLNDIGRDDPALLVSICTRWAKDAPAARLRLIRHALRTLVKRGDPHALAVLGFAHGAQVALGSASVAPARVPIGGSVEIVFELRGTARRTQRVLVDLRVSYARAARAAPAAAQTGGAASAPARPRGAPPTDADPSGAQAARVKVFKLAAGELAPGETMPLRKRLSLRQMSTRTHHPGVHRVEALVNGVALPVGEFEVVAAG